MKGPVITLTGCPKNPYTGAPFTNNKDVTITFSINPPDAKVISCRFGNEQINCSNNSFSTTNLADGIYSFYVAAMDAEEDVTNPEAGCDWTVDTVPPEVSSVNWVDGTMRMSVYTNPTVGFTDVIDASSVTLDTFVIKDVWGSAVPGSISLTDQIATFNHPPETAFNHFTAYYAAVKKEIRDKAGNQLGNDQNWRFTTGVPLAAGYNYSLAIGSDEKVWAWGSNSNGQLGDGTTTFWNTPVEVGGIAQVISIISSSGTHSLALKSDGTVWAWGSNANGQLGDGTTTDRHYSTQVKANSNQPLGDVIAVSTGNNHSIALKSDGMVMTWGSNSQGQLGNGSFVWSSYPVSASNLDLLK